MAPFDYYSDGEDYNPLAGYEPPQFSFATDYGVDSRSPGALVDQFDIFGAYDDIARKLESQRDVANQEYADNLKAAMQPRRTGIGETLATALLSFGAPLLGKAIGGNQLGAQGGQMGQVAVQELDKRLDSDWELQQKQRAALAAAAREDVKVLDRAILDLPEKKLGLQGQMAVNAQNNADVATRQMAMEDKQFEHQKVLKGMELRARDENEMLTNDEVYLLETGKLPPNKPRPNIRQSVIAEFGKRQRADDYNNRREGDRTVSGFAPMAGYDWPQPATTKTINAENETVNSIVFNLAQLKDVVKKAGPDALTGNDANMQRAISALIFNKNRILSNSGANLTGIEQPLLQALQPALMSDNPEGRLRDIILQRDPAEFLDSITKILVDSRQAELANTYRLRPETWTDQDVVNRFGSMPSISPLAGSGAAASLNADPRISQIASLEARLAKLDEAAARGR